jgi:hypothetical protein
VKVRDSAGRTVGLIERVQHGYWFADGMGGDALGAFPTRDAARQAVLDAAAGQTPVGRINPTILIGPPPRGQA